MKSIILMFSLFVSSAAIAEDMYQSMDRFVKTFGGSFTILETSNCHFNKPVYGTKPDYVFISRNSLAYPYEIDVESIPMVSRYASYLEKYSIVFLPGVTGLTVGEQFTNSVWNLEARLEATLEWTSPTEATITNTATCVFGGLDRPKACNPYSSYPTKSIFKFSKTIENGKRKLVLDMYEMKKTHYNSNQTKTLISRCELLSRR